MSEDNFQALVSRVDGLEAELKRNSEATARVESNTADIVEAFQAAAGAFKALNWIGKIARPVGYVAAAVSGIVAAWSGVKGGWK
ncbi:hypothetical protein BJN34_12715 [Cupriavidus necator]|uniref:Uncharacterized protein n=1 Tax=Cupriavidus necator TaxID=106590 RepID=A0A1U9UQ04_CUPNE|nr:hypothetical protein [Cupriavidus necator]AQV94742.1 hypothetical protein BJN34_12715 [Cupriavidus necator]